MNYQFDEDAYIAEIRDYIEDTYDQHYSAGKSFQTIAAIIETGHGEGFCIGNILKYAQRYGRKGSHKEQRKDLMKVIHYAIYALHVHDTKNIHERD